MIGSRARRRPVSGRANRALAAWLVGRATLIAVALATTLGGCGGVASSAATTNQLTVYSSLPLQGPTKGASAAIVDGEKLALAQVGGRIGPFRISFVSEDDSDPLRGRWDPGQTASDAKTAAQDRSAIAYLGEYDSGASAISLPLMNAEQVLQLSPGSAYIGLTSSQDAGQDEPYRFYPSGVRTFGRLSPSDRRQAQAQARLMHGLGVHALYVLSDQDPFQASLASLVAASARRAGIRVVASDSVPTATATDFSAETAKVTASNATAMFFAGAPVSGAIALWQQLAAASPRLRLFGSSTLAQASFVRRLGPVARKAYLTTPVLPLRDYPPVAQRVLADYRRIFGLAPRPEALSGYEAMALVLESIRRAGRHGNDRHAVITQFFSVGTRDSVLGRYSVLPSGDTTLSRFAVERVRRGRLVFYHLIG